MTEEGYEAALACDGEMLEGQRLKVERCKSAGAKGRAKPAAAATPSAPAAKTPGYHVAYVGNVAFDVDDSKLSTFFEVQ